MVYSSRCSSDKRCWKLYNLGERSLSAYGGARHRSSRYCPERASANLQTRRGYFNPWQAGRDDKWACRGWLQSSPALHVAVPALLLVRLGHRARAADVVGQVGPEPLGFPQLPYDLHHLQQEPRRQKYDQASRRQIKAFTCLMFLFFLSQTFLVNFHPYWVHLTHPRQGWGSWHRRFPP